MVALAAHVSVPAAVLPGLALELPSDAEQTCLGVVAVPPEPDGLALPGPDCQSQDEPDAVAPAERHADELANLGDLERLHLVLVDARRLRESHRVADDVPASQSLAERRAGGPVDLVRVAGPGPLGDHSRVKPLEVLGADLVDALAPESRDEMLLNRGPVSAVRLVLDGRPGDVLQPVA